MDMLGYYVAVRRNGKLLWLADDEKSWSADNLEAAEFTDGQLAKDIGEREAGADDVLYVYGLLHS